MVVVLLIVGIGLLVAGLLTVGYGILLDLSFGNTLILTGTIVACTGVMMLGLWFVVRELRNIGRQLGPGIAMDTRAGNKLPLADPAPDEADFPTDHQPAAQDPHDGELDSPPPWHEEAASRDRGRGDSVAAPESAEAAAVKPKRNLLFSSTSRKERERAQARTEPSGPDVRLTPPTASTAAAPPAESGEAPPATFDDAWPKPERARAVYVEPGRRGVRGPVNAAEPSPVAPIHVAQSPAVPPPVREEAPPQVTVLKSGVVDGMAYSLYSDGSIEAQMPEGMMRFASIDELRAHLDQRP